MSTSHSALLIVLLAVPLAVLLYGALCTESRLLYVLRQLSEDVFFTYDTKYAYSSTYDLVPGIDSHCCSSSETPKQTSTTQLIESQQCGAPCLQRDSRLAEQQ